MAAGLYRIVGDGHDSGERVDAEMKQLIEAVPNVSEGRRPEVVRRIVQAAAGAAGSRLLDWSSDAAHNRTVITLAGDRRGLLAALLNLYEAATAAIDIRVHSGEHPRVGAVDVVPFVALGNVSIGACVDLARALGRAVAERFGIPVFLYEDAASRPERRALEDVRRGQLAGLAQRMTQEAAVWGPDFGPAAPHATAGVSVIGVRPLLIAFNVNLATEDVRIARRIARTVRARGGGLPHVKAIGVRLADRRAVQVAMNLTDYTRTPPHRAFEAVAREACKLGVRVAGSEVVGLVPADALVGAAARYLRADRLRAAQVLDARLGDRPGAGADPYG